MAKKAAPLVLIIAGETSGDILGGELMLALRRLYSQVRFAGIGGAKMLAAGLEPLAGMEAFPGMGLVEVLGAVPKLLGLVKKVTGWAKAQRPAVMITIDNQEFSARLAAKVAPLGIPCVQYVAPKVWAWRQRRVVRLQKIFRQMLCLFPFEVDFFNENHLPATYIGHPVALRMAHYAKTKDTGAGLKLALLPGSRRTELKQHWPLFLETFRALRQQHPTLQGLLALPDAAALARCRQQGWDDGLEVVLGDERFTALQGCRAALTKSGTNNLELALLGLPAVVVYRLQALSWAIISRLVKVKAVSPVNLVANGLSGEGGHFQKTAQSPVYPEYLQQAATVAALTAGLNELLTDTPARRQQLKGLAQVCRKLQTKQVPAELAAAVIREIIEKNL